MPDRTPQVQGSGSLWDDAKRMDMLRSAVATGFKRTVHMVVPTLDAVLEAYERDLIDSYDLDTYIGAAVAGRCVEETAWMRPRLAYKPRAGIRSRRTR